ncbi:MAG: integrase core domain-containing protein [bacterium]
MTPNTLQQNSMVELSFRSLKQKCAWVQTFSSPREAIYQVEKWIRRYNDARPYQAQGFQSPAEYRQRRVLGLISGEQYICASPAV